MLYESEFTFRPNTFPYNADVIAVWANDIGPLQISNRYNSLKGLSAVRSNFVILLQTGLALRLSRVIHPKSPLWENDAGLGVVLYRSDPKVIYHSAQKLPRIMSM